MSVVFNLDTKQDARVLLLSLRKMKFHVSRCYLYELEDSICELDSTDILTPELNPTLFKVTNRLGNSAVKAIGNSKLINPLFKQFNLEKDYDLFWGRVYGTGTLYVDGPVSGLSI